MPTYEYLCRACGHRFERFQKISDAAVRECPECGAAEAERLISAGGGIVFKGAGFYATDYRKEAPPSPGEAADTPKADTGKAKKPTKSERTDKPGGGS